MIRVLVAEDSVTAREVLVAVLESDPDITVVGQAKDGVEAVELAKRLRPDLITMDVHMPVLDGFEATKEIMVHVPTPVLIVSSSHSRRDVELSLNAMRAGALMVIAKPENPTAETFGSRRAHFVAMVKAMADVKVVRRWERRPGQARPSQAPTPRRHSATVRLVAIGASTGGPVALEQVLSTLPGDFPVPILIVQHIAAGFVDGLAQWLSGSSNLHVKMAADGEALRARCAYLAPDGSHLGVTPDGRVRLTNAAPLGGIRPSASHLFESAAQAYGPAVAAVILTGMGRDGVDGLTAVRAGGGYVIAQDEATSVVYGMPREAVAAGVVDESAPIGDVAARLLTLVRRS